MIRHLLTVLVAALFAGAVSVSPTLASDEAASPPARIIAVGDLHGDYPAWQDIASEAGIVDDQGDWTGGTTIFVQLGDVTDRGPGSLDIIASQRKLQEQATEDGGKVLFVIGNHEAMNVIGDLRYTDPGEYAAFADEKSQARIDGTWKANKKRIYAFYREHMPELSDEQIKQRWFADNPPGKLEHQRAWQPGGDLGQWAATLPAVVKIGNTLFVHGGLSIERAIRPLGEINSGISAALAEGKNVDRSALDDPFGPLWYRGNVLRDESDAGRPSIEDELSQVLAYHNAKLLVVGHTPSMGGIQLTAAGQLVRIDTGISSHYGGPRSFLEITPGGLIAHERSPDGEWTARTLE